MSSLKIRLVPRPGKNDPDFESYKNFVIFAQKKFTVLRPDENGNDAVMIVLPIWLEPFRKLTEMLGDVKIGDYFSYSFVIQYIDDSTSADLNNFRLDKSAYVPYDANAILKGEKRWSDIWPIHEHERVIVECEIDNTLARATSNPERNLEQDEMVLFKSCLSTAITKKNKPKAPKQAESNGRSPTRRTECHDSRESGSNSVRSPARNTGSTRKRAREPDSDSDDAAAFRNAQPSATCTSPRKRVIDTNNNKDENGQKRKAKPPITSVVSAISSNVRSYNLNSFSPISPPGERNQVKWKTKKTAPPAPQASSSNSRTINQNDTDVFNDEDYVPDTPSSSRSSSPEPGPAVVRKGGNGKRAYTPSEDMAILQFLDEFNRHRNVAGYASYKKMAELQYFKRNGRTEQSLLTRFKLRIRPNITTILAKKPEMLQRFKEGLKWAKQNHHQMPEPFAKEPPLNWEPREK